MDLKPHGLFIGTGYQRRLRFHGDKDTLRKLVDRLTPAELREGWAIAPLMPAPVECIHPENERPKASVAWTVLGASIMTFFVLMVAMAMKGCH